MLKAVRDPIVVVASRRNPSREKIEAALSSGQKLRFALAKSIVPQCWGKSVMLRITSVDEAPRPGVVLVYGYYSVPRGMKPVNVEIVYDTSTRVGALVFL
jgi:ABC-type methionine transport system ATPase subunit